MDLAAQSLPSVPPTTIEVQPTTREANPGTVGAAPADGSSSSRKNGKPKPVADPLMRPLTRAQTRAREVENSDTPRGRCAPPLSPLTEVLELPDRDDASDDQLHYEVEEILEFKYDEHVCVYLGAS